MKKVIFIATLFAFMSQFAFSQNLVIYGEDGKTIITAFQLNSIDSIYFTHAKCPLDEQFGENPLSTGWNYTNKSNATAKIASGNSSFWVADSSYGTGVPPQGIEIEKDLGEIITKPFEMTAKAIIRAPFPDISPKVSFGLKNGNGDLIYHVELTRDSLIGYDHGTRVGALNIVNNPDPTISIWWFKTQTQNFITFNINGKSMLSTNASGISISKLVISIRSDIKNNSNEARVDFIKMCRLP